MRKLRKPINKELLKKLYVDEGKSSIEISKIIDVPPCRILYQLKKYGFNVRHFGSMGNETKINKKDLYRLYVEELKTLAEIGKIYDVSARTIKNFMNKYELGKYTKEYRPNFKIRGDNHPTKRPEVQQKMRDNHYDCKGDKNPNFGATWMIGEGNPNWKGGITSFNHQLRNSDKYNDWKIKVYQKDRFSCKYCKKIGKNLHAHHVISWSILVQEFLNKYNYLSVTNDRNKLIELALKDEKLWDINNGITHCGKCHSEEHPNMNYIV